MKVQADVDRLLLLRRRRERIAFDDAVRQDSKLRAAERGSAEAEHQVDRQVAASRAIERKLAASLAGCVVSANAVAHLKTEVDVMSAQTDDLASIATAARNSVAECQALRDAAGDRVRLRQRDVTRLDLLAKGMRGRHERLRRAIDEAINEDLVTPGRTSIPAKHG